MDCRQAIVQALIDRKIVREEQGDSEYIRGGIETLEELLDSVEEEEALEEEDEEEVTAAVLLILQGEQDDDGEPH